MIDSLTSAVGVPRSVYSWTPARLNCLSSECEQISPGSEVMQAGSSVIESTDVVLDLEVMLNAQLHVDAWTRISDSPSQLLPSASTAFCSLARLGRDITTQQVVAFVFSRRDYCNAVLVCLPAFTLAPLSGTDIQRVLHAVARWANDLGPDDLIAQTLKELHWLPIAQRIEYKLCLLLY